MTRVLPSCPNCNHTMSIQDLYYQWQKNNTLHLMANCPECKKPNIYCPRIDSLNIPVIKTTKIPKTNNQLSMFVSGV
jgi:hypothetical protein